MPPFEDDDLLDKAALWASAGVDDYAEPLVRRAVQIDCRWVGAQSRVLAPDGNTIAVDATAVVAQDIAIGSIMYLLPDSVVWRDDETVPGTGTWDLTVPTAGLMQVKAVNGTYDIKRTWQRRTVGLMRYNSALPRIV